MNDFLFKLNAYNMPKTMVPGAFQTAFPVKWPLKFNMKLPAYAVGSDLTNLGKDLERLGFGPGTYRTYGANAGTLRQPIKTSNYIKKANNSSGIRELLQELQNSKLTKLAVTRTFGNYNLIMPVAFRKPEEKQQVKKADDSAQTAAEDVKNTTDAELKRAGINVDKLEEHYATLARTKIVLEKLQENLPRSESLDKQIDAINQAMEAIVTLREISNQINQLREEYNSGIMPDEYKTETLAEYHERLEQHFRSIQERINNLVKNYDRVARGVLYPNYYTLSISGLYNKEEESFITDLKGNGTLNLSAISQWLIAGRYTTDVDEKRKIRFHALSNGIVGPNNEFTPEFASQLLRANPITVSIPVSASSLQNIENIQPQIIKSLPGLSDVGAGGEKTQVLDLLSIDRDRIKNALTYVIHARRAIEQNAQQSDIQSTDILTNLTNLERSLGTAYAIADYLKRNSGNAGEQLSLEGVQAMRNNLTNSLAKANSALTSLRDSGAFNIIKDRAGIDFIHALRFNPNVNQLLNKFGTKPLKLNEDTANELQQKYTDPTVVDNIITQIVSGKDVTFAAGIPSSTTSTTDRGIKLPEPKPESQKPDTSVVRESLYTVYPEEARKVETLEAVMQDPVLNRHYNFTGHIDTLKKLRNQVEQLAGLVQQNPAYEMAYRRALSIYNNVLRSTLSFANVAAKDVYNLERIRRTINSQFGRFEQPGDALPEDVKKQIQQEKEKKITELFTMQKLWEDWKRQEESLRKLFTVNLRFKYRNEEEAEAALQEALDQRKKEFIRNKLIPALPIENRGRFGSDLKFTAQIENIIFNTNPQQFQKYITGHARESAQNLARQYAATLLPQQAQAQQPQAQQPQPQQPQQPLAKLPLPVEQALRQSLPGQQLLTPTQQFFAKLLPPGQSSTGQPLPEQSSTGQASTGQPASGRQLLPPPTQPVSAARTPTAMPMQPTPTATQNLGPPTSNLLAQTNTNQNPKSLPGLNLPKVTKISSYNKLSK